MDERKLTGVGFALNMLVPINTIKTICGELKTYSKLANSGNTITNHACTTCGSLLYRSSTGYPDVVVIKAGCADGDEAKNYVPSVELFTRSRLPWVVPIEGAKQEIADFTSLEI
jgi:hypothetical protein